MAAFLSKKTFWIYLVVAVVVGIGIGLFFGRGRGGDGEAQDQPATGAEAAAPAAQVWTCSMHPQIRQPDPGKCPICGMDLIALSDSGGDIGPRQLRLTDAARELARIQVQPVERRAVEHDVRMVGAVAFDETRQATITAWVAGRLDRLYVDYTGIAVNKGDHMVWLYSPDMLTAQEELLQAKAAVEKLTDSHLQSSREHAQALVEAVRDKLRLWGLTDPQIAEIETRGTASDHIQINAPVGGIVVHKSAVEGEYVKVGAPIYRIADLSQVWVKLDAYESDLAWLRYGQDVRFTTQAYPGDEFHGRIAFIDPVLTEKTRTVKVRVNVPNADGRLKPGMFVRAAVTSRVAAGGKVIDSELAGKWIGPMHPEIIRDEPGDCPICGMPLEQAEKLGFISAEAGAPGAPLVIPATAPLLTGKRAVVYVQDPDDASVFTGKEIVLGPRTGSYYTVEAGLSEGEMVVTNGAFKIDSALQIQAKPSMMSADAVGEPAPEPPVPATSAAFRAQMQDVFAAYLGVQRALAGDDLAAARAAAATLQTAINDVDMTLLEGAAHTRWMTAQGELAKAAATLEGAANIDLARGQFERLSTALIDVGQSLGTGYGQTLYIMHCPMAFDNEGADWLQDNDEVANPYFGAVMLGCGEEKATLAADPGGATKEPVHE